MEQIMKYQEKYTVGNYTCTHTINDAYIYPDSMIDVVGSFFIGHSHHQFDRKEKNYHVINVGSVGQNRKEINVINYAVYETESDRVILKSLVYDIKSVIDKMRELRYPEVCIAYYLSKDLRK